MSEWRLAWRNVWRNPRRTALTVAATVFAAFLLLFMVALARGTHGKMIEDNVRLASGHVMISAPGYLDGRSLDYSMELNAEIAARLDETEDVEAWAPRIQSFGLLSESVTSQGAGLLGVVPERERQVTTLASRVSQGRFLSGHASDSVPGGPGDALGHSKAAGLTREIVLGERLAKQIGAKLGDEVLVYSMAYSLETAYELFRVVGLLKLPNPGLERTIAVMDLRMMQDFLVLGDRVTEIALLASDQKKTGKVSDDLVGSLGGLDPPLVVQPWWEVLPEVEQMIFLDAMGLYILVVLLIVVVGFGILNTVLMAVLERQRELGVMLALGLRPAAVFRMVFMESLVLAALGLVIGVALALPLVLWFSVHPIELTGDIAGVFEMIGADPIISLDLDWPRVFTSIAVIIFVAVLASIYPAIKASRANPVDALRSV